MKKFIQHLGNFVFLFIVIQNGLSQEIFPSGTNGIGGSYNLTYPAGTCFQANRPIGNNNTAAITKGPNYSGPFQTHQWWNSALWHVDYLSNTQSLHSGVMHPHPMMVQALQDGFVFRYRNQDYQAGALDINYFTSDQDIKVGLENRTSSSTLVDRYGHWDVTLLQQTGSGNDLYLTSAAGCPYGFFEKTGSAIPVITGGNLKIFAVSPTALGLISNTNSFFYPDKYFILNFPMGTNISLSNAPFISPASIVTGINSYGTIRLQLPSAQSYFSIGILPDNSSAAFSLFALHGLNFIINTDFTYTYDEANAKVNCTYTTTTIAKDGSADEGTLQALYRHQYLFSPQANGSANTGFGFQSPRGIMKLVKGNSFSTEQRYFGLLPMLAKCNTANQSRLQTLVTEFANSPQIQNPAILQYDLYNTYIAISQAARMAEVANQVGLYQARNVCLDAAKYWIESWLRSPNGEICRTTHYSPNFNWMTSYPDAFQADIGMHDAHFMYGYLIHGAAIVGRYEKKRFGNLNWVTQWQPMIDLMIRNINDWNKTCSSSPNDGLAPCFPYLRYFDPYAGHSWALNYTESQESVSEAVQFAAGAAMWGDLTGNAALRDMGIMLYVHESEAGRQYWLDVENTHVNQAPFAPDYPYQHAGIVFSYGAKYGTFFGTQPYQIHGITYWAISGSSIWLGKDVAGLQRDYSEFISAYGGNVSGTSSEGYWSAEMLATMALFNASGAKNTFTNNVLHNDAVFAVNSEMMAYRGIAYQFISTLDSVGWVDADVLANTDFYAVFIKNGCRHYMVWNGPNQIGKTVQFTDGKQFFVPSDTLMVVKDCNLNALPIQYSELNGEYISSQCIRVSGIVSSTQDYTMILEKSENGIDYFPLENFYTEKNTSFEYLDCVASENKYWYRIRFQNQHNTCYISSSCFVSREAETNRVELIQGTHDQIRQQIAGNAKIVVFDLLGRCFFSGNLYEISELPFNNYLVQIQKY